jgi:alcohol dehydrogenase class IV
VGDADFTFLDGERLIRFGDRALEEAPQLLAERGFQGYVLLTTDRAAGQAPELAAQAAAVLSVPPGPVPEAAAAVREDARRRPLVGLGGGRVIDAAKAIAASDRLACAAVPTTLSGAELTPFHRLPAGVEDVARIRPELVIAAPALMASQPMPGLAASAMNALAHAAEALYVELTNPVAELAGLRAASLIAQAISATTPPQGDLALGALLAGYASGVTCYGVHHVVCQTIVRVAGTPHAQTNAVMLPHVLRLMERRGPEALAALAGALGAERERASLAAEAVDGLAAAAGVRRLSELGVDEGLLGRIAATASVRPELDRTPEPPREGELLELLQAAL